MDINAKINKRNAERLLDELMDECKRIGYELAEDELKSLRAEVETLRREREELLGTLERMIKTYETVLVNDDSAMTHANATLAKVKP